MLGSPKPSQQGDAASPHDDNIPAQDDGGFSVLMVALYLQQVSRSSKSELGRPGIFLYKNQGGESVGREDKEKTAPDSPRSWLPDMIPNVPTSFVEFRVDLRISHSDLDIGVQHISTRVKDISAQMIGNTFIVFFTHGYGISVLQQILRPDRFIGLTASTAAVIAFANPLVSPEAAEVVRKGTTIQPGMIWATPNQMENFRHHLRENTILLREYWERSLSDEPFNDKSKRIELITIAEVTGAQEKNFQKVCRIVQRAIIDRRVFMAARSSSVEGMRKLINDGYNIKVVTYRGRNVLHLAVQTQNLEMVKLLVGCRLSKRLIKQRDRQGNTALHIAISSAERGTNRDRISIVRTLFDNGASRVAKNSEGLTPMAMSVHDPSVKDIINQPQRVGRLFVPVLSKGEPPGEGGREACMNTEITITNISKRGENVAIEPEEVVKVQQLLYGERKFSDLTQIPQEQGTLTCQWFHIPTNNVRFPTESCCPY